jgi:hypothetical protein
MTDRAIERAKGATVSVWFEEYLAAWATNDAQQVADWVTDDVEFEDVGAGHRFVGRDRMARFAAKSFELVPDATFDFVGGTELGDSYYYEWIMQPMGVRGVSVGERRDGKIAKNRDYWNGASFTPGQS